MMRILRNNTIMAVTGLLTTVLLATSLQAQEYDSIAARYKNEDAVIVNYTQRLVITNEDGKLVANSYFSKEKLFISELSRGIYNRDYLFHSDFNQLEDLKAVASLPTKNGYKKVNCYNFADVNPDRDNVFYDDSRLAVVTYTGLAKNAITKTTYAVEHTDLHLLPPFYFQTNIPIVNAAFEVTVPDYVQISFVLKGVDTGMIRQSREEKQNTVTYRFTIAAVPAAKEFENVPSPWYYLTQVIPYITSYKLSATHKKVDMLGNTDQLYKYMYKNIRNMNMKDDTALDNKVAEITKNDTDPRDKARHIYQWVQGHMHYIAFEKGLEGFVPREAAEVMKREYGDCKDMTAILVTMCRKAGLDAHYTWIGTRDKPYSYEETPLPLVADHMICALKLGDDWIFMDGTHPYIPFGKNPDAIQGKEAMIAIDEQDYKIVKIPVAPADQNVTTDSTIMSFSDSRITGTVKQHYTGYEAWRLGVMMMYLKGDDWNKTVRELTERGSDKYTTKKHAEHAGKTAAKDATIETEFTLDDYVLHAGRQCYVNMNLKRTFEDQRINAADRKVPHYYDYKHQAKEVVVLDIPKGYRVAHVPPAAHGTIDGLWSYKIAYKTEKNRVTLVKEYELNTIAASPELFAANNKMVDELNKLYKETVVLTAN